MLVQTAVLVQTEVQKTFEFVDQVLVFDRLNSKATIKFPFANGKMFYMALQNNRKKVQK